MKEKGFTLIELLAVIVMLAVIALIATPLIINVIDVVKKQSVISSGRSIIRAGELLAIGEKDISTIKYDENSGLQFKGKQPSKFLLEFNENMDSELYAWIDGYCVIKNYDDIDLTIDKDKKSEEECFIGIKDIVLENINYIDDNYLFSGEIYYLNPYDLDVQCQNENDSQCMKWYEISEDDKYVTLILNSNLGDPIEDSSTITETTITYLNSITNNWDLRLAFPSNTIIDGYNFSNSKARILSAYEIANIMNKPNWNKDSFDLNFELAPYLKENLDFESWYQGGFFTLTPYDDTKNYVVNKYGLDASVSDGYTNGVRPVIVVEKKLLHTYHNKLPDKQNLVTYLSKRMITVDNNVTESAIRYQVGKMKAAGIGRAYLNVGSVELIEIENEIILENELESIYLDYQDNVGKWIKISQEYGIKIVPWINYSMNKDCFETNYDDNRTWGDLAIEALVSYVDKIENIGYFYDGTYYKTIEIHYDAEPTRLSYQPYYLETIKAMRNAMNSGTIFSAATAAGKFYDEEFIKELSQYLDEFDVMTYDSMGPNEGEVITKNDYMNYVNETIEHYKNGISGTDAKLVMIGPMYEDTYYETEDAWPNNDGRKYNHMNFYQGEEVETMRVFIEAIKQNNQYNINGIGFYNWTAFTYPDSDFNTSDYITEDYNQKVVIEYIMKNWVY